MESLKVASHQDPPMSKRDSPGLFTTRKSKTKVLWPFMEDWFSRGNLKKRHIPASVFFSLFFSKSKQNGKLRQILDQSQFNTDVVMPSIVMETLNEIQKFVNQVMWATSFDVTDAYLTVPIHESCQKYFCVLLVGKVYMISRLPLGLTMVPWVFLQIMRPIKVCIRLRGVQVNSFLDDFLILAITSAMCTIHTALTEKLLICLGFEINYQKPSLILY